MRKGFTRFIGLAVGSHCAYCESKCTDFYLCAKCRLLEVIQGPLCRTCGHPLSAPLEKCGRCEKNQPPFQLRTFYWLTPPYQTFWSQIKIKSDFMAARHFLSNLDLPDVSIEGSETVTFVPCYFGRYFQQSFYPSLHLAHFLSNHWGLKLRVLLQKKAQTPPQKSLRLKARLKNLNRAFAFISHEKKTPQQVLLVDDVFTSGATVTECSQTLLNAGVQRVQVITLFRTPSPHSLV